LGDGRKGAKTREKEGEVVLLATDPQGDTARSIGVQKCEILLNHCKALDSEGEGETSAVRFSCWQTSKAIKESVEMESSND